MIVRKATAADLPAIHMMNFDAWGEGLSLEEHVNVRIDAPKYKKGEWYVLENNGELVSSMICYRDAFGLPKDFVGIGSVATDPKHRKHGYASYLIKAVTEELAEEGSVNAFFLYSDVSPPIYERLGFVRLAEPMQNYETSVAMLKPINASFDEIAGQDFSPPEYF